jgi:peptidoglycan/LPS O-acetylase OafA/YrhL
LDGLRGIAALMMATRHAPNYYRTTPFFESYLAVDFFFVLSGFILAHAYGEKLRAGDIGVWEFTKIRIVRLFPLYLLAHLIVSAFAIQSIGQEGLTFGLVIRSITFGMFMLPTPSANSASALFPLNGPTWSLFFEMVANIVFAFISTKKSSRWLIVAVVTLSAVTMVVAVYFGLLGFGTRARFSIRDFFGAPLASVSFG